MSELSVIYFVPVRREFFEKWEYYQCDYELLNSTYRKVIVCHNLITAFINLRKSKVVFCWWWHSSFPLIVIARLFGKKVICTGAIHMFDYSGAPDFYTKSWMYRLFTKLSLKLSSMNLFISADQKISITSHLSVNTPVTINSSLLPSAVNIDLEDVLESYRCSNTSPSVQFLFMAWLTHEQILRKGLFPTIHAFAKYVKEIDKKATLVIAGKTGNGICAIKNCIFELEIENNVFFCIDFDASEKRELFKNSDLLINPSYMEGFGNACLEAMAYGLPVLVSRFGASHEVIGNAGFIINSIDSTNIYLTMCKYGSLKSIEKVKLREMAFSRAHSTFNFNSRLKKFKELIVSS